MIFIRNVAKVASPPPPRFKKSYSLDEVVTVTLTGSRYSSHLGREGVSFPGFQIFSFPAWIEPTRPEPHQFPILFNVFRQFCGRQVKRLEGECENLKF
jgi:hypothetical protein